MHPAPTRRLYVALLAGIGFLVLAVIARGRRSHATSEPESDSGRREGVVTARELEGMTRDELYARARAQDLPGRSKMNKAELQRALLNAVANGR